MKQIKSLIIKKLLKPLAFYNLSKVLILILASPCPPQDNRHN